MTWGTAMKARLQHQWIQLVLLLVVLSGCAHVISSELRSKADVSLTFSSVLLNPDRYKGKLVIWGGEVIQTVNQKDGTTVIEILQRPLNGEEEPQLSEPSGGRFLVHFNAFADPHIYLPGRIITVAGDILGSQIKALGEMQYKYPLLESKQICLWDYYPAYPPYYYYNPYYPYYPVPYFDWYYYPYYPYYYGPRYYYPYWGFYGHGHGYGGHRR